MSSSRQAFQRVPNNMKDITVWTNKRITMEDDKWEGKELVSLDGFQLFDEEDD